MAVLVDLVVRVAFHEDVVFSVHCHHRHLAEHVHHGLCLRLLIGLHVVADAVYLLFDQLALGLDDDALQFLVPCDGVTLVFLFRCRLVHLL